MRAGLPHFAAGAAASGSSPEATDAAMEEGRPDPFEAAASAKPSLGSAPALSIDPYSTRGSMPGTPELGSVAAPAAALKSGSSAGGASVGSSRRSTKQQQMMDAIAVMWEINWDAIKLGAMIGKGSYGKVNGICCGSKAEVPNPHAPLTPFIHPPSDRNSHAAGVLGHLQRDPGCGQAAGRPV